MEFIHETQSTATILIRINGEDVHKDDHVNVNDNKQFMKCIISIIDDGRYTELICTLQKCKSYIFCDIDLLKSGEKQSMRHHSLPSPCVSCCGES